MNTGATFLGVDGNQALFSVEGVGVVFDTCTHSTKNVDLQETFKTRRWLATSDSSLGCWTEIAGYAVELKTPYAALEVVTASSNKRRGHTVPKAVAREARLGLDRSKHIKQQTEMSLFTGRMLAAGGQISYPKLQHVARFLNSGTLTDVPSRNVFQRTTWSLWGGDAARRWVNSMIQKQTLALTSDGFLIDPEDLGAFERDDVIIFALTQAGDPFAAEGLFFVNDGDDSVNVWDAGHWTPYGETGQLDELAERLVEVDEETAMDIAASLDESPGELVYLSTLNLDETALAMIADFESDAGEFSLLSRVAAAPPQPGDGNYTPDERSANAGEQPRDSVGRFATVGAKGTMKGGVRGTIRGVNPTNNYLLVEGETDNRVYSIPSKDFTVSDALLPDQPVPPQPAQGGPGDPLKPGQNPLAAPPPVKVPKLDLSKILGQPRALPGVPKAMLDRALPPLDPGALRKIVTDYNKFIQEERNKNARKFSALFAIDGPETATTPDTSDVKPIYMAVVDKDDPKAVMDLISLSPSSTSTPEATTFRRVGGQWIRDDKVLRDLKSPTPPPVVVLNDADYQSVLTQVDSSAPLSETEEGKVTPYGMAGSAQIFIGANNEVWEYVLAAGNETGAGAAERLRIYWTKGKGGIKIRWGTGGDWKRCHRYLSKYLGDRAKGYCAIRHHEMNGYWPGDQRNLK